MNPRGPRDIAGQRSSLARAGQQVLGQSPYPKPTRHDGGGPAVRVAESAGSSGSLGRGLTRLRYEVVSFSSEDPSAPASAIQGDYPNVLRAGSGSSSSYQNGWCSQKFCSYPQELVLQFETPLRLKSLQILSHESRISSRVELFYIPHQPNLAEAPLSEQVCRIGTFTFDDADRYSSSPSREMKTVHLTDIYTQYIKLDLYQPYDNPQNIFQQVSLISVSCVGQ